jgi:hypothetical protein
MIYGYIDLPIITHLKINDKDGTFLWLCRFADSLWKMYSFHLVPPTSYQYLSAKAGVHNVEGLPSGCL